MHNWRLLLLAFVAVFQPIASFTERGVDGRHRCDNRAAALLPEPGVHFHGTHRFSKPAVKDSRLNQEDVRRIRHNEVREESFRSPLQSRFADDFEKSDRIVPSLSRLSRTEYRLTRNAAILSRETQDEREAEIRRARQATLDSRLSVFDDERRILSRRSRARLPLERQQELQRNRQNTEAQRGREIRNTIIASDRVSDDAADSSRNARRIARERTPRIDVRSERMQLERNSNNEMKRSTGAREYRAGHSLDHDRRSSRSQQSRNMENLQRTRDARDSILRERILAEGRLGRDLSARTRESHESFENRRDFISYRDARIRSQRDVEARREIRSNEPDTRLTRAMRLEENRVSRNSERENSIETRRDDNVIRNMEKNYRTTESTAEYRRNIHSNDRENYRDMRKTIQELRGMQLDRARVTEVRGGSRDVNRRSCSLDNDRKAESRSSERVDRLLTDRNAQNQRSSRIPRFQRDAENERANREVRRESSLGRNIRMHFGNTRSTENDRSQEVNRRESRNSESRRVTKRDNRKSNDRRALSYDRLVVSRRDTRESNRDARIVRHKRSSEARESERISQASTRDVYEENRRTQSVERQSRITRDERNIGHLRAIRSAEMNLRSTRREGLAESRRDTRNVDMENRTDRNTEKDFRSARGEETRVFRERDTLSLDRKSIRVAERLNMRGTTVDSRRSRTMEQSDNMDLRLAAGTRFITETTRKQELHSATGKHDENETSKTNWQYLFYTLQGLYLCGILTQLMNAKKADMKTRALFWWSAPQHLIKVD